MATGVTNTGSTGGTDLIPALWAEETRDSLLPNLLMPNLMDRSFEAQLKAQRGDRVHIHGAGGTAVDTISGFDATANITLSAGGTLTSEVITFLTRVSLVIDTHAYKYADLEVEFDQLSNFPLMQRINERTAFVVRQKVDDDCAGLIDNFSQTVGTLAVGLTDANILRAVQYLNDANAQDADRFFLMSAAEQLNLLQIDRYVSKLYQEPLKGPQAGKFRGYCGQLYGVDCYMSTNVEGTNAAGHDCGLWQKQALLMAMVDDQRNASDYEISTDSMRVAIHSLYGIIEGRDTSGIWVKAK